MAQKVSEPVSLPQPQLVPNAQEQQKPQSPQITRDSSPKQTNPAAEQCNLSALKKDASTIDRDAMGKSAVDYSSDELARDMSILNKRRMDSTADVAHVGISVEEPPQLRSLVITLDGFEKVGEEWLTYWAVCRVNDFISAVWLLMSGKRQRVAYSLWALTLLIGYFGFYVYFLCLHATVPDSTSFAVDVVLLVLSAVYIYYVVMELFNAIKGRTASDCFITIYTWFQCMYIGISVFMAVVLLFQKDMYGVVFATAVYSISVVHAFVVTLWTLVAPVVAVSGVIELVVRLLLCRMSCPYIQPKQKVYNYALYRFGQGLAKGAKQCTICLEDYTAEDSSLCVLKCITSHVFHEKCIFEWIKKQEYCPICRSEIKFAT